MAASYSFAPDGVAGSTRPSTKAFGSLNGQRTASGVLTIGGTYTSPGGDALAANLAPVFQLAIKDVIFKDSATSGGRVPAFDGATGKLKLMHTGSGLSSPLVEVGNGQALSDSIRVMLVGV
jgi:hypothetical protein